MTTLAHDGALADARVPAPPRRGIAPRPATPGADGALPARIALLGTGGVGRAVLARLSTWSQQPRGAGLSLVHVANSRHAVGTPDGLCARQALLDAVAGGQGSTAPDAPTRVRIGASRLDDRDLLDRLGGHDIRIVIDATASESVADRHAAWLAQGVHVVTACKLAQGTSLARWRSIQSARVLGGTEYGDAATVGAGLPLLRSIRALRRGGDRIHALAGVLSGSLAWLFAHYDGTRPFSALVRDAAARGYTEPDPREDLSGEDVRRKLLILARSAGVALESGDVDVATLLPTALSLLSPADAGDALELLDAPLRDQLRRAQRDGRCLRFVARLDDGGARIGLEALKPGDALALGNGCDNRVAIWSDRYREQPLVIQGPGAGAEITAAAVLDDVLDIAARGTSGRPGAAVR